MYGKKQFNSQGVCPDSLSFDLQILWSLLQWMKPPASLRWPPSWTLRSARPNPWSDGPIQRPSFESRMKRTKQAHLIFIINLLCLYSTSMCRILAFLTHTVLLIKLMHLLSESNCSHAEVIIGKRWRGLRRKRGCGGRWLFYGLELQLLRCWRGEGIRWGSEDVCGLPIVTNRFRLLQNHYNCKSFAV